MIGSEIQQSSRLRWGLLVREWANYGKRDLEQCETEHTGQPTGDGVHEKKPSVNVLATGRSLCEQRGHKETQKNTQQSNVWVWVYCPKSSSPISTVALRAELKSRTSTFSSRNVETRVTVGCERGELETSEVRSNERALAED